MRFTSICLYTLVAAVALVIALSPLRHPPAAHSTEAQGDRWRLPWTAGVQHLVGGNGYGQDTHTGTDAPDNRWALDFEGRTCGPGSSPPFPFHKDVLKWAM